MHRSLGHVRMSYAVCDFCTRDMAKSKTRSVHWGGNSMITLHPWQTKRRLNLASALTIGSQRLNIVFVLKPTLVWFLTYKDLSFNTICEHFNTFRSVDRSNNNNRYYFHSNTICSTECVKLEKLYRPTIHSTNNVNHRKTIIRSHRHKTWEYFQGFCHTIFLKIKEI